MQRAVKLIKSYESQFPDCIYYVPLFGKARRNITRHPDICIETCKALLEGISKTIIMGLDDKASIDDLNKKDVEPLVKAAAKLLRANDDIVEDHFVNRVGGLAHSLGALRNARGDISHGKAVPKQENSSDHFARLCLQMTDAVAFYMLKSFFMTRTLSAKSLDLDGQGVEKLGPPVLPGGIPDIPYEANAEFNDWLDQKNPLFGKLLYSDALYRLYYEDYVLELQAYTEDLESDLDLELDDLEDRLDAVRDDNGNTE
ncbi:abortive infection family protein [Mesorhizobium sp. M0139]|uniref:abortive infection family protein n=1 Tax=Mesorhizobium sp. M0139 TaxID=2956892 RepID=UPI00333A0DFC